jgi:hypothetical protein
VNYPLVYGSDDGKCFSSQSSRYQQTSSILPKRYGGTRQVVFRHLTEILRGASSSFNLSQKNYFGLPLAFLTRGLGILLQGQPWTWELQGHASASQFEVAGDPTLKKCRKDKKMKEHLSISTARNKHKVQEEIGIQANGSSPIRQE